MNKLDFRKRGIIVHSLTRLRQLEQDQLTLTLKLAELEEKAKEQAPYYPPAELASILQNMTDILASKDTEAKKELLRHLISHIDIERNGNTLRGTIYYFLPDETDPPPNPDDDVPTSFPPSGPPLRRHIMQYHFIAHTERPRS